jgi:N-acetylmuramoyl-L-alanine amidase
MIKNVVAKIKETLKGVRPESKIHILLDNGHSSSKACNITPGKRTPYLVSGVEPALSMYEGDFNRDVVKILEAKLKASGYNVHIIVPEEEDVSLGERVRRANKLCSQYGASNCIFVSIHSNAAGNGRQWMTARGFSVHICQGASKKSELLANLLYDEAQNDGHFKMRKPLPNQKYWVNNFYVIKNTLCPAILSESGFYDNVDDCTFLLTPEAREAVANMHYFALIKYIQEVIKK